MHKAEDTHYVSCMCVIDQKSHEPDKILNDRLASLRLTEDKDHSNLVDVIRQWVSSTQNAWNKSG